MIAATSAGMTPAAGSNRPGGATTEDAKRAPLQDAAGNFDDCALTLRTVVVSF